MEVGSRGGVHPREQRWEFWSFEPEAGDMAGARPITSYEWRCSSLLPVHGGVFYHLPVDTRIQVGDDAGAG